MSDEPDSSKFPCTSVASESPLHPTGKHPLSECFAFSKKQFPEKVYIIENKRCFLSLGPHFKEQ